MQTDLNWGKDMIRIHDTVLLCASFAIVLGCSIASPVSSQGNKPATPNDAAQSAEAMRGLRDKLLTSSPEEMGLGTEDASANVWGVLMEIGFQEGVVTVVSMRDGTANIYVNTGGGLLGGHSAQKQAQQFISESDKHLAGMKLTKSFPYPTVGKVIFYVLTQEGVYSAAAGEQELIRMEHALSPLFRAGNEVLIGLRSAGKPANPTGTP